jgi:hypothetical protein
LFPWVSRNCVKERVREKEEQNFEKREMERKN